MKYFEFQEDLKASAIEQIRIRNRTRSGKKLKKVNSIGIPLKWLLESSAKLMLCRNSKNVHIIVTEKPRKGVAREDARVLIPGVDYELYIEGFGYTSPDLGDKIGICEEFPPKLWP